MLKSSKIFIAGHNGMVGSAIMRLLLKEGYSNIITRSSREMDLRNQDSVAIFFAEEKPEFVFLAAAKVGGILANDRDSAMFIYDNLMIQSNVIHQAYLNGVKKLLFLGSSCIYPKMSPQPIKEDYLLSGYLEPTNQSYAIAKIAGIELCRSYNKQFGCNFISVMPSNLYGPNDNYDLDTSHVLPAMLRKFITAQKKKLHTVELWGTGLPRREFLHVDDLADGCLHLMKYYNSSEIINIGTGTDIALNELANIIIGITNYSGEVVWNIQKPDGTPKKVLDVTKIQKLGWSHRISLLEGLNRLYIECLRGDWANQL